MVKLLMNCSNSSIFLLSNFVVRYNTNFKAEMKNIFNMSSKFYTVASGKHII